MEQLFSELKRRKVFRAAGLYAVIGWLLAQVATTLEDALNLPELFDTVVVSALLVGFPLAVLLSWLFEFSGGGLRLEQTQDVPGLTATTARRLNVLVIGFLGLLTCLIGWQLLVYNFAGRPAITDTTTATDTQVETNPNGPSIAVMAFEDFTAEADQAYFAKGISEELLNVLARIEGLRVPSRTSSFAFQGTGTPVSEIGKALNVAHVLEGSVRKAGTTLRITAQLIDTRTDAHLWSQTYDRPLTAQNLFAVQDEIAAAVVQALSDRLQFVFADGATSRTSSVEAYQVYLRARDAMNERTTGSLDSAARLYAEVIALDPAFAPAYSGLADTFLFMRSYGDMTRSEAVERATPLVDRALTLAPDSAEALTSAAFLAVEASEVERALAYARKAIEVNPNYGSAYLRLGSAHEFLGQTAQALAAYEKAQLLDPLSPIILSAISYSRTKLGDLDGALETAEYNLRWNPENFLALDGMTSVQYEVNDFAAAHYYAKQVQALNPKAPPFRLFDIYLQTGMYEQARRIAPGDEDLALVAVAQGNGTLARSLLSPPDSGIQVNVLFYLRDFAAANATTTVREFKAAVLAQETPLSKAQISPVQLITAIAEALELPEADALMRKLDAYYAGAEPEDSTLPSDLYNGAVWCMLRGDRDAAYPWLERFVESGFTRTDLRLDPVFDPVRDSAAFSAIQARNDTTAAAHRRDIVRQLAAPEASWIVD
jgi:TolB-like protein/tetratricopeptide (TPR) repeat protein